MSIYSHFEDKSVLITGGTGSFGRALAKRLLSLNICRKVIIFSRDEWKQWEMREQNPLFQHPSARYFLGDIRDAERLARAFHEVDIVIHAAALKQVITAEYNPSEFIKTNIIGGMNVVQAAIDAGVKHLIALSTDKAVNPINLYGATKLCSDKLFVAGNSYVGGKGYPKISVVRYGNVMGSRGSVLSHWQQLIENGAKQIPITDTRMTRFWITIPEAVDFVLKSVTLQNGWEIFVAKCPSINIIDLADALAPDLPKKITGIREGEKLHEMMISHDDARHTLDFNTHYTIFTDHEFKKLSASEKKGKTVPEEFLYTSNTNDQWLSKADLKDLIKTEFK